MQTVEKSQLIFFDSDQQKEDEEIMKELEMWA